jgi:citrate lyase beta subunit
VGGTGGQASGHRGIMVELEDGAAEPDDDPRRPTMRSAPAAPKPDGARRWLAVVTCEGRRGEWQ